MSTSFESRCKQLIAELGIGSLDDVVSITPLTGGVSSDIALVDTGNQKVCVKFALEKLKVAEDWYAPVGRNRAEYDWLSFAASIEPGVTPDLLGYGDASKGFAMEFVEGDDAYLWKTALLKDEEDKNEAGKVGHVLGKIHKASAASDGVKDEFQNQEDFFALRLEPYLCFTATRHPALAAPINELVEMLNTSRLVLVHGDVSPKNIIFKQGVPILLDAECATIGDPSFDISFCLNHLVLKAVHISKSRKVLLASVGKFWSAYKAHISWEEASGLEARVCRLLPALMLARVDGKSPVEYLDENEFQLVRSLAVSLIEDPEQSLDRFVERVALTMENKSS
jgi:aminoglycoside phosphotransferase (APT) family kinase protein